MPVNRIRLAVRASVIIFLIALFSSGIVGFIAIHSAGKLAEKQAREKLEAARDSVAAAVDDYFSFIHDDLILNAKAETTYHALQDFRAGWDKLPSGQQTAYLQKEYIDDNPNKDDARHLLNAAPDLSIYSFSHFKYHPWFREILTGHKYYDVFLISAEGDVLYSVYKEDDFATNLVSGKWKDSELGSLFRAIKSNPDKGRVYFEDFKPYAPSANVPAAFIGTAITDQKTGEFLGVYAYQMPIGHFNKLTQLSGYLGKTIKAQFVGVDRLQRNDPHPDDFINPILKNKIDTPLITKAFEGQTGTEWSEDAGEETLNAFAPFDAFGKKWVISVDIHQYEFMADVDKSRDILVISALCICLFVGIFVTVFSLRN